MSKAERVPGLIGGVGGVKTRGGPDPARSETDLSEKIAQGHDAELVARTLREELGRQRAQVEQGVFAKLKLGEVLSGEKAVQAWLELYAVHRLEQHLRRRIQLGEAAGSELAGQLDEPGESTAPAGRRRFPRT